MDAPAPRFHDLASICGPRSGSWRSCQKPEKLFCLCVRTRVRLSFGFSQLRATQQELEELRDRTEALRRETAQASAPRRPLFPAAPGPSGVCVHAGKCLRGSKDRLYIFHCLSDPLTLTSYP